MSGAPPARQAEEADSVIQARWPIDRWSTLTTLVRWEVTSTLVYTEGGGAVLRSQRDMAASPHETLKAP